VTFKRGVHSHESSINIAASANPEVYLDAGETQAPCLSSMPVPPSTSANNLVLLNGARNDNVFWILGTALTMGADSLGGQCARRICHYHWNQWKNHGSSHRTDCLRVIPVRLTVLWRQRTTQCWNCRSSVAVPACRPAQRISSFSFLLHFRASCNTNVVPLTTFFLCFASLYLTALSCLRSICCQKLTRLLQQVLIVGKVEKTLTERQLMIFQPVGSHVGQWKAYCTSVLLLGMMAMGYSGHVRVFQVDGTTRTQLGKTLTERQLGITLAGR
jgi:hypothetical protein